MSLYDLLSFGCFTTSRNSLIQTEKMLFVIKAPSKAKIFRVFILYLESINITVITPFVLRTHNTPLLPVTEICVLTIRAFYFIAESFVSSIPSTLVVSNLSCPTSSSKMAKIEVPFKAALTPAKEIDCGHLRLSSGLFPATLFSLSNLRSLDALWTCA
jgi:hypothetical protein